MVDHVNISEFSSKSIKALCIRDGPEIRILYQSGTRDVNNVSGANLVLLTRCGAVSVGSSGGVVLCMGQ